MIKKDWTDFDLGDSVICIFSDGVGLSKKRHRVCCDDDFVLLRTFFTFQLTITDLFFEVFPASIKGKHYVQEIRTHKRLFCTRGLHRYS